MKISINQIRIVTGDLTGNYDRVRDGLKEALDDGADIVVFPETALTGYCAGALWDNEEFILEQESLLRDLVKAVPYGKCMIIGYVRYCGTKADGFPSLRNSVAVINCGRVNTYDKQLLANADHHEDKKYFKPGRKTRVFKVNIDNNQVTIGVPICEDAWYTDHHRDIPKEMVDMGAQIIISINQSYFYYGKQSKRMRLFMNTAVSLGVPVLSVNAVGIGDIVKNIIIFDGSSIGFGVGGIQLYGMSRFKEDRAVVQFNPQYLKMTSATCTGDTIRVTSEDKYSEIIDAIVFEQAELFKLVNIGRAQVHISGGVDSAVVMALSILSMGKSCVFITNPTSLNSKSLEMVDRLAENFNVEIYRNELQDIYDEFMKVDRSSFGESELDGPGKATVQAVLRTVQGLAASHRFMSGIVACGNHTEIVLGWASFHDIGSIGVHAPIGDLTKTEVFELCKAVNERFRSMGYTDDVIPRELFDGTIKPAAQLPDAMDDPIDYNIQSGLCAEVIRNRKTLRSLMAAFDSRTLTEEFFRCDVYDKYKRNDFEREARMTISRSRTSVYKAAQSAPIVILSPRSRGFSNRETIINGYRM